MLTSAVVLMLAAAVASATDRTCEPIRIETCHGIGYNVTGMPNLVGHELQQDAELQLQTFTPLIQYECSSRLRFFLCAVYVPMCTEKVPLPIGPCRGLCEDIRDRCQPVLQEFGLPWPAGLNCSKFPPQNNDKHMCMEGPADQKGPDLRLRSRNRRPSLVRGDVPFPQRKAPSYKSSQHYGLCKHYRFSDQYYYINRTGRCAPLCFSDISFSADNKTFAEWWHVAWFGICFVCTLFNFLVVLVGDYRFRYPEGAVIVIGGCFNACAIAHIIRQLSGRYASSCHMDPQHNAAILIQEGLDNANCTIIFVILYFFRMAANGWWVVLSFTYYLSCRGKAKHASLLKYSTYYHLFAWGIPSSLTVAVLITQSIDADELVGTCFVGNQSSENLLMYVIAPSLLYLGLGLTFLILSLFPKNHRNEDYTHVQTHPPLRPGDESDRSATSLVSFFTYLYIVPFLCVFGTELYEYANRESWIAAGSTQRPIVEIFSLKLFMLQVMGILSILVVASSDVTRKAGQKLSQSILRKKKPVPSYLQVQPQPLTASCRSKRSVSSRANSETIV